MQRRWNFAFIRTAGRVMMAAVAGTVITGCSTAPSVSQSDEGSYLGPLQPAVAVPQEVSGQGDGETGLVATPVSWLRSEDPAVQMPVPPVAGRAYIVVNARTGKVLAERNARMELPVASTQKLLTALVLLDSGNLDQMVTVASSDTQVEPTVMGIRGGERYRRKDLLEAMMVRSCNDIAKCLARTHSGSEAGFVAAMNAKAQSLGMRQSHFVNSHGLSSPGGYSTAYDLSLLARAAASHSYLHRLTETREIDFAFANGRVQHLWNTNRVLYMTPYCRGLKTGYTEAAGRCLVACGERAGRRIITVVLGSKQPDIWTDSMKLIHWALGVNGPA